VSEGQLSKRPGFKDESSHIHAFRRRGAGSPDSCTSKPHKAETANRAHPKDEDDWCKVLLNKSETSASRSSSEKAQPDCEKNEAQPKIIAGEGWGPVRVGAASKTVEAFLGEGKSGRTYSDVYFKSYLPNGLEVSFENTSNTVHAIYFYNRQRDEEEFGVFCGRTDKGIRWQSSIEEVKRAYGQPTAEFSGNDSGGNWNRLVFAGIDFRFENGKMVRIGIPGN
jgi:hypothetical protein